MVENFLQLSEPVIISDTNHNIIAVNLLYEQLTGYSQQELIGNKVKMIKSDFTPRNVYSEMYSSLEKNGSWNGIMTNKHKCGQIYNAYVSISTFKEESTYYYIGISRNLENVQRGMYLSDDKIEDWNSSILLSLAKVAESEDPYISEHVKNVKHYSEILSCLYKEKVDSFSDFKMLNIGKASLLHDVGKSMIPNTILYKPGKLSYSEYEIVKEHSKHGFQILQEIQIKSSFNNSDDLIRLAQMIALYHHEKWDGTGYPCQLARDNIPIEARIVSIADVLDALRSHRVYKSAWSDEKIIEYFKEQSGKQFDPMLIEILLENFDLFISLYEKSTTNI